MWASLRALPTINYNPIYENVDAHTHKMTNRRWSSKWFSGYHRQGNFFFLKILCSILSFSVFANLCTEKSNKTSFVSKKDEFQWGVWPETPSNVSAGPWTRRFGLRGTLCLLNRPHHRTSFSCTQWETEPRQWKDSYLLLIQWDSKPSRICRVMDV